MEVKPGYKQTEVGVIPEDWEVRKTGQVCGFIVPGRNKPRTFDGDIPWITTPDLQDGRVVNVSRLSLMVSMEEAKAVGSKVVPAGAVLMSCAGELGIVAITGRDIVINQQLHAFLPSTIDGLFLAYALKTQTSYIDSVATQTAVPYLNKNNCNSIPIPLPPTLLEQKAIATALSDVDALISSLDKLIEKKRNIKQGAMQELLTGKKRLPGFGGEWTQDQIGNCVKIETGAKNTQDRIDDGGYPFFVRSAVVERINSYSFDGEAVLTAGDGVGTGKIFHYINGKFDYHQRVYKMSHFRDDLDGYYFYLYFSNSFYDRIMSMTAKSSVDSVRMEMIADMMIPLPPLKEQEAIAEILTDIDSEICRLSARLDKARRLKQGMMQELLTGKTRLI